MTTLVILGISMNPRFRELMQRSGPMHAVVEVMRDTAIAVGEQLHARFPPQAPTESFGGYKVSAAGDSVLIQGDLTMTFPTWTGHLPLTAAEADAITRRASIITPPCIEEKTPAVFWGTTTHVYSALAPAGYSRVPGIVVRFSVELRASDACAAGSFPVQLALPGLESVSVAPVVQGTANRASPFRIATVEVSKRVAASAPAR